MRNAYIYPARLGGYTMDAYIQSVKKWSVTVPTRLDAKDAKWAWIQHGVKPTNAIDHRGW